MGDPRRFHLFANVIADLLPRTSRVADVAGGRGILQSALRERGFSDITSWDRRRRTSYNRTGHRWGYFSVEIPDTYDAIVAMHPDESTDHCILFAGRHQIPDVICPCCVRPSARAFWDRATYDNWCAHLERLAQAAQLQVRWEQLPMNGRNDVMILTPHHSS